MYQISKEFHFSAAHRLAHLPANHQCHRAHGHNYIVVVVLESDHLDDDGFVVDYGDLSPIKAWIDQALDHRDLNEVLPELNGQTTAENLARVIFAKFAPLFPALSEIRISETPKTWASYRPGWYA